MNTGETPRNPSPLQALREPSVFNYSDYREYLKDFYRVKKSQLDSYSYAVFSLRAGIKSPNYLKLVMEGKRNLTPENTLAFARGLGLGELETLYWENLVSYTQAKTPRQRQFFLMRLSRAALPASIEGTHLIRKIRDEWEYYSGWHHAAIREMALLPDFQPDPSAIAQRLRGRITAEEARASLQLLKRLGFLAVDASTGRLVQCHPHVRYGTPGDVANLAVRQYHRESARLASEVLEDDSEEAHEERNFRALTIAVNRRTLPLIKARLTAYIRELNTEFTLPPPGSEHAPAEDAADQVYQLNLQLMPLTTPPGKPTQKKARH